MQFSLVSNRKGAPDDVVHFRFDDPHTVRRIGRDRMADFLLDPLDTRVGRRHAELRGRTLVPLPNGPGYQLTLHNGRPVTAAVVLDHGDRLRFGADDAVEYIVDFALEKTQCPIDIAGYLKTCGPSTIEAGWTLSETGATLAKTGKLVPSGNHSGKTICAVLEQEEPEAPSQPEKREGRSEPPVPRLEHVTSAVEPPSTVAVKVPVVVLAVTGAVVLASMLGLLLIIGH